MVEKEENYEKKISIAALKEQLETQKQIYNLAIETKEQLYQAQRAASKFLYQINLLNSENNFLKQEIDILCRNNSIRHQSQLSPHASDRKYVFKNNFSHSFWENRSFLSSDTDHANRIPLPLSQPLPKKKKLSFPNDLLSHEQPVISQDLSLPKREMHSSSVTLTPTHTSSLSSSSSLSSGFQQSPTDSIPILKIDTKFIKAPIHSSLQIFADCKNPVGDLQDESKKSSLIHSASTEPTENYIFVLSKEHICNDCSSRYPFGFWSRDPSSPDKFLCQLCYASKSKEYCDLIQESVLSTYCTSCLILLQAGKKFVDNCNDCAKTQSKAAKYSCCNCYSNSSTSGWYKTSNGALCRKCYHNLNRLKIDSLHDGSLVQRTCLICFNFKSTSWYRDPQRYGGYICKLCYNHRYQIRINDQAHSPRFCGACSTTVSSQWIKDQSKPGEYLCKKCYHLADKYKRVVKADGSIGTKDCCLCEAKKSSRWYRDCCTPSLYNCVRCYNKRKKEDKKICLPAKTEGAARSDLDAFGN